MNHQMFMFRKHIKAGRTAMLTAYSGRDQYRVNTHWFTCDHMGHEAAVEAIRKPHAMNAGFAVGDTLQIVDLSGDVVATCEVKHIAMAHMDCLTDFEFGSMGFKTLQEFRASCAGWDYAEYGWLIWTTPLEVFHER
ncbi:MAG: hypothetical protein AAF787_00035 [Chloroflexota bacterium]